MTIKEKINADFMEAYKAKNMEQKNFLGVIKGAIQTQEGKNIESTDENVLKVLKTIEKGINENIEGRKVSGLDVSEQELELSFIKPYLPELMSENAVREAVKTIISESEDILSEPTNKKLGLMMGKFMVKYKNAADMKMVKRIIDEETK